jgi:nucleoside-diphosphate-sugar epimerase
MTGKHVLVAGGAGVVGRTAINAFEGAGWSFTTLNRDKTALGKGHHIPADLLDPGSLEPAADTLKGITHLFYAALKPSADPGLEADENAAMLENLIAALRGAGAPLERITFIQGGKVYGAQLGVYKTTAVTSRPTSISGTRTSPGRWKKTGSAGRRCAPISSSATRLGRR